MMGNAKRPKSVTVLAWFFILAGLSLVTRFLKSAQVEPITYWTIILDVILLISGIAILKGYNWGRIFCLISLPMWLLFGALSSGLHPRKILAVSLFYTIVAVLLTGPSASPFFTGKDPDESESEKDASQKESERKRRLGLRI